MLKKLLSKSDKINGLAKECGTTAFRGRSVTYIKSFSAFPTKNQKYKKIQLTTNVLKV